MSLSEKGGRAPRRRPRTREKNEVSTKKEREEKEREIRPSLNGPWKRKRGEILKSKES